ncbi:hypothetical protein Q3G72_035460 [Acer saccharum]|nr:hypothetical protein Q3G72_035460 [Acer saccharum]
MCHDFLAFAFGIDRDDVAVGFFVFHQYSKRKSQSGGTMDFYEFSLKEFADFSQKVKELKCEFAQCMQLMRAEIEQWDKALEIMKNKELESIERLAKAEQEIRRLTEGVTPFFKGGKLDESREESSAPVTKVEFKPKRKRRNKKKV